MDFLSFVYLMGPGFALMGLAFKLKYDAWRKLPTLRHYLERFPHCRSAHGIQCAHCGASSIRNWGLYRADSVSRTFICNHCGQSLYRSEA